MSNNNLTFDDGVREFTVNGHVIKINLKDLSLMERFWDAEEKIENYLKEESAPTDDTEKQVAFLKDSKKFIYEQINIIFNSDIAETVFNGAHPLTPIDGKVLFQRFLDVIMPVVESGIDEETKKSEKKVSKYTGAADKYK